MDVNIGDSVCKVNGTLDYQIYRKISFDEKVKFERLDTFKVFGDCSDTEGLPKCRLIKGELESEAINSLINDEKVDLDSLNNVL